MILKRKKCIQVIDAYKLNLYCTCAGCRHCKSRNDASKYCVAHPRKLPPEIWNAKNAECSYFEKRWEMPGSQTGKYHITLFIKCLKCKKYRKGQNFSCDAYPIQRGIQGKIWNHYDAVCPYFDAKEQDSV